jgi:hypothetical protein
VILVDGAEVLDKEEELDTEVLDDAELLVVLI